MGKFMKGSSLQKQQQFANEYLKDQNETQAAIRAGYARKGAAASGRRLLNNPKVRLQIQQLQQEKEQADKHAALLGLSQQEILDFLTLVLRGGQGNIRLSLASEENIFEKSEILQERMRAAELLGQYFHLFEENHKKTEEKFYISALEEIQSAPVAQTMN